MSHFGHTLRNRTQVEGGRILERFQVIANLGVHGFDYIDSFLETESPQIVLSDDIHHVEKFVNLLRDPLDI